MNLLGVVEITVHRNSQGRKGGAFQYSRRLTRLMDKPLWGLRVLKFDGAIAPRVLKFDSGFAAEGCGGRLTFIEGALL